MKCKLKQAIILLSMTIIVGLYLFNDGFSSQNIEKEIDVLKHGSETPFTNSLKRVNALEQSNVKQEVDKSSTIKRASADNEEEYNAIDSMRRRAQSVRENCISSSYKTTPEEIEEGIYLITKDSQEFLYKPVPKIGWTTWIYMLFENKGMKDKVANKKFFRKWQWGWGTPYEAVGFTRLDEIKRTKEYKERFLIMRHPYDRLVSAYKNKALEGLFSYVFKLPCKWLTKKSPRLTFPQFVQCILDRAQGEDSNISSPRAALTLNPHWQPLYSLTLPCETNYTLIADFDHFEEDSAAIVDLMKFKTKVEHANKTKQSKTLGDWFKELSEKQREGVKKLYKFDFLLFGFDDTMPV